MAIRKLVLMCYSTHMKFQYVVPRVLLHSLPSSQSDINTGKLADTAKKKVKMTVLRKCFPANHTCPSSVLKWKDASAVIKKLNWENKHLFGPIQPKSDSYDKNNCNSNQIIQHTTQIPIFEPDESIFDKQTCDVQAPDLNIILDFPLVNMSDKIDLKDKVYEYNNLRKYLEYLKNSSRVPSVSTILEKTMTDERRNILDRWKENMIKKYGEDEFQKYYAELLATGSSLHNTINNFLSSESQLEIEESNIGHWESLKAVFPNISNVKLLEEYVLHPFLCYRGVVDCFAKYKDQLVVIDWKTSKKTKSNLKSTYDNPLQIAAYVGALNFDPKFQYLARKGLIVVAYESGKPASVLYINETVMVQYWKQWVHRVKLYWEMIQSSHNSTS